MEIKLLQREAPVWIAGEPIHKQVSVHAETVVPDTAEDVQEIVWTRGGLLLKSKEPGLHAATVTGEAWASVLYLTETGKLESIRLKKDIEIEFEAETADPDALPHISWYLSAVQGKLLNPRKLGVSFEIQANLQSFQQGSALTETVLPEGNWKGLHVLSEKKEALSITSVTEKPFTLREQLFIPDGQKNIEELDAEELRFELLETEQIGSRCIVKGELKLLLWGRDGEGFPVKTEFPIPMSQLLDITEDSLDQSRVWIEPNSVYLEWTEGSGEGRSLDLEVHALLQLCALTRRDVITVSDAYSSAMPFELESCEYTLLTAMESGKDILSAEETLALPEDVEELLAAEAKVGVLDRKENERWVPLHYDFIYRRRDGSLGAVRRNIKLDASILPKDVTVLSQRVLSSSAVPGQKEITLYGEVEVLWERAKAENVSTLSILRLEDENPWSKTESPSVVLVRRGGENLWDLAREYRSSVDLIRSCNAEDAELLLIPAEI